MEKLETGLRLICVDDEKNALFNCEYTLKDFPNIQTANFFLTPEEALDYAKTNPIDIALLDIDLPQMSGFELAKKLKEIYPLIEIAFITGNMRYMSSSNREVKAPYIFKPYTSYEVSSVLKQVKLRA